MKLFCTHLSLIGPDLWDEVAGSEEPHRRSASYKQKAARIKCDPGVIECYRSTAQIDVCMFVRRSEHTLGKSHPYPSASCLLQLGWDSCCGVGALKLSTRAELQRGLGRIELRRDAPG